MRWFIQKFSLSVSSHTGALRGGWRKVRLASSFLDSNLGPDKSGSTVAACGAQRIRRVIPPYRCLAGAVAGAGGRGGAGLPWELGSGHERPAGSRA